MKASILILVTLLGCNGEIMDPSSAPPVAPPPEDPHPAIPSVDTDTGDPTGAGLATDPHRPRRRMDLDQLDASIQRVTGGIGWTERRSGRDVSVFETLGPTLGRPDWVQITEEDMEPSALFQKFLDDMARDVCTKLATAERTRADDDRRLLVEVELTDTVTAARSRVDANLAALILAYHGRVIATDSRELDPWRDLFMTATVAEGDDPVLGWRAVCVGLMTHPDFYSY